MYRKLLVPVDGSLPSMLGLKEAIRLAKSLGSNLQLVHVINEVILTGMETPPGYMDKVIDAMRCVARAGLCWMRLHVWCASMLSSLRPCCSKQSVAEPRI